MASIVLKNKSLFIPGRGEGGKVFGLRSDHMGGRGFWDFGGITWGGGRGTENSLLMKFHSEGES